MHLILQVNSAVFPFVPKLLPNSESKSVSNPTKFAKDYTFGFGGGIGHVLKDGTGSMSQTETSLGSVANFGSNKDQIISGGFGIEIPVSKIITIH